MLRDKLIGSTVLFCKIRKALYGDDVQNIPMEELLPETLKIVCKKSFIQCKIKHSKSVGYNFHFKNLIIQLVSDQKFNKMYGHTAHTFSCLMSNVLIWEWFIYISIRFQMTDNNIFLAVSPADLIT